MSYTFHTPQSVGFFLLSPWTTLLYYRQLATCEFCAPLERSACINRVFHGFRMPPPSLIYIYVRLLYIYVVRVFVCSLSGGWWSLDLGVFQCQSRGLLGDFDADKPPEHAGLKPMWTLHICSSNIFNWIKTSTWGAKSKSDNIMWGLRR